MNRKELLKYLKDVTFKKKNSLPILDTVLLQGDGEKLSLSYTDLEVYYHVKIDSKDVVQAAVNLKSLIEVLSSLNDNEVTLSNIGDTLVINEKISLRGEDVTEFPPLPKDTFDLYLCGGLGAAFQKISYSASTDDVRPSINGIHMVSKDGQGILEATDGFRIAQTSIKTDLVCDVIIPNEVVKQVQKSFKDDVLMGVTNNQIEGKNEMIMLQWDNVTVYSALINWTFPDTKVIFPKSYKSQVTVQAKDFTTALMQAERVVAKTEYKKVILDINDNLISVSATAEDVGSLEVSVSCDLQGDSIKIGFNCKYILDYLKNKTGEVTIKLNNPNSPALFEQDGSEVYLLMPMRLG